jgi:hypothetical protein
LSLIVFGMLPHAAGLLILGAAVWAFLLDPDVSVLEWKSA